MATLGPYEVHPAADAYPLIGDSEFDELVESVRESGLREPITLNHDKTILIDGRNRYRACVAAGVEPKFTTMAAQTPELTILKLIVDRNERRRHMNAGQKAMVALVLGPMFGDAIKAAETARKAAAGGPDGALARIRQNQTMTPADLPESLSEMSGSQTSSRRDRESRERVAKAVGASGRSVQQAKAVQRDAPDLAEKVRSGEIALDAADRERRQRIRTQPRPEPVSHGPVPLVLRTHDGREFPYPQPKGKATFNQTPGEGISWAEWSWNPVTGCLHGCGYCYAREIATSDRLAPYYPAGFTPLFHHERLDAPRNTSIPAAHANEDAWHRVFVCSMADLYGRWVPDEWIEQVHAAMLTSLQWEYLLLTKFPSRYVGLDLPPTAWLGTSVDEQRRVRIAEDAFRQIDGVAVKWLSLEPLNESLEFTDLSMFDWVVIGAQTETRQAGKVVPAFAPPFEWVARITAQAREAGCKVHMKPNLLGAVSPQLPGMQMLNEYPSPPRMRQGDLLSQ
jgi:protein gp37/ParB-like chromosome segregation protein Spo0J